MICEKPVLYLDCDDVVLDFMPSFIPFVKSLGFDPDPGGPGDFNMAPWLGITKQDVGDLIRRFNEGEDSGFGEMGPIPGAVDAVGALRRSGYRLMVVSSFSDCRNAASRRWDNLTRIFGVDAFEDLVGLPLGSSKADFLNSRPSGIFIDDLLANAVDGHMAGHASILFRAHHNASLWEPSRHEEIRTKGLVTARNWEEALQAISTITDDFSVDKQCEYLDAPETFL